MQTVSHYLFELRGKIDLEIAPLEFEDMLHEERIEGECIADRRLGCDGAVGYGTITATGDLLPCHFFEGVRADSVRQRDFSEVWRKSRFLNYFRSLNVRDLHGQCQACRWLRDTPSRSLADSKKATSPSTRTDKLGEMLNNDSRNVGTGGNPPANTAKNK